MKKSQHLTPGEFELMEIVWPLGEASVKDVWEKVNPARGLAYTTVMTVLEKMHRKGFLSQRKKGKAYLYSPVCDRNQARTGVLNHICETYFAGSYTEMISFMNQHFVAGAEPVGDPKPAEPANGPPNPVSD